MISLWCKDEIYCPKQTKERSKSGCLRRGQTGAELLVRTLLDRWTRRYSEGRGMRINMAITWQ